MQKPGGPRGSSASTQHNVCRHWRSIRVICRADGLKQPQPPSRPSRPSNDAIAEVGNARRYLHQLALLAAASIYDVKM
jgi:hypothetical protein